MGQPIMYQVNIFIPFMLFSGSFYTNEIVANCIEKDTNSSIASKIARFPMISSPLNSPNSQSKDFYFM